MNLNRVFLGGRLTADPELKQTTTGKPVTSVTVAIDRKSGQEKNTDFINCVAFQTTAELICKYLHKGNNVLFEGAWTQRKWQDRDGKTRIENECLVKEVTFIDGKSETVVTSAAPAAPQGKFKQEDVIPNFDDENLPF